MVNFRHTQFNALPNDKILDWSKLKAFADNKINVNKKNKIWFMKGRKHCGKRRKCWLPAFSPFSTMFSKGFFSQSRLKLGLCGKELKPCVFDKVIMVKMIGFAFDSRGNSVEKVQSVHLKVPLKPATIFINHSQEHSLFQHHVVNLKVIQLPIG